VPSFMPPEQQVSRVSAIVSTPEADSWAIGFLLFLLLTGELPFTLSTELKAKHVSRISARIRDGTFVEPAVKAMDRMPAGARNLLESLLSLHPAKRLDPWQVRHRLPPLFYCFTKHMQPMYTHIDSRTCS
jgi:serine/threonine protein kinase